MYKWNILFFLSLILNSCQWNELVIPIAKDHFYFDAEKSIVLCQIDLAPFQDLTSYSAIKIDFEDTAEWAFADVPTSLKPSESYTITFGKQTFKLFFTTFPIIHIDEISNVNVPLEEKSYAAFSYLHDTTFIKSDIGIEYRGETTLKFPKRNYDLEFWLDKEGDKTQEFQLGGLRTDDDWILDAIYNEPTRMNAYLAHKLWLKIHTPYYQKKEKKAKSGADVAYVEVVFDKSYQGVFMLSEQVDRKQLQLKKLKDNTIKGQLIKGRNYGPSILFRQIIKQPNKEREHWDGYELKYPKFKDTIDWSSLYEFTDFVINSTNNKFKETIDEKFELNNAIDYFIFVNVTSAMDNMAKNIYTARYNSDSPYFYVPWDLDGTWGYNWEGEIHQNATDKIYSNGLYNRLLQQNPQKFRQRLVQRWQQLRQDLLTYESLKNDIEETHQLLLANNVFEKEMAAWKDYKASENNKKHMLKTIQERLEFLDRYFDKKK